MFKSGIARLAAKQRGTTAYGTARLADEQRGTAASATARLAMERHLHVPLSRSSKTGEAESASSSVRGRVQVHRRPIIFIDVLLFVDLDL